MRFPGSLKAVKQWTYSPAEVEGLVTSAPRPGTLTFTADDDVRTPAWGASETYAEGTDVTVTEDLAKAKPPVVPGWDCTVTTSGQYPTFTDGDGQQSTTAPTVKIKGDTVFLDGNHPWAGKALRFSLKVVEVRAATPEEITHRHAHGAHGHHH